MTEQENKNIRLIHGDCLEEMAKLPDKSIDAVICDLPFGIINKKNPKAKWDCVIPFDKYGRIIKNN